MCTAIFWHGVHPALLFALAFNRDEFLERPTEPAHFWTDAPAIIAGRDAISGGTWLGMSKTGRVSFLTNYREGLTALKPADTVVSRGSLVTDFLESEQHPMEYLMGLECGKYQHFSLVVGNLLANEFVYLNSVECTPTVLTPGVHGFSNGGLDTTAWRKVADGKRDMEAYLEHNTDPSALSANGMVAEVLSSTLKTEINAALPQTPNPLEVEHSLSSIFVEKLSVKGRPYGTRSQTVVLLDHKGNAVFHEAHMDPSGAWLNQSNKFSISGISPDRRQCQWTTASAD